ncbi:DegT/DnrJ/EryC1/StrS family aminotransferase [Sulfidibacter corallicola]|uniref:Aminotransferase class I/II-fold pyridoxal phosphate-dependent enzyme n=1 Tax=Sulfidibacter corallicola TaxID=2818388 RepID=A0A8A4TWD2_SULCO|nr:DegT/DnrJ/EryC1/StrS family aminotransferase [Sulfidibacter corallicola]QTD53272.1 aminotransferase class I/II-fold pyridoxal phosphate-dependent enzyme [Sulfidibacter corallicola]
MEAVVEALLSGTLTQGKELERFEALLSKLTHSDHAIALNSGTAAVHAALACLKLEPEDEVITSTMNFSSITNMVRLVGAKPVLVDCDPNTLTMNVEAAKAAITDHTKAIFTNNFGGHPSDLQALREICDEHNLVLIEDACHGLGGKYRGHYVGNQADITCFSFHPSKAITTCEGGAITTNNRAIADWIRLFRQQGIQKDRRFFTSNEQYPGFYQELQFLGMNYRMSEVHAALGRSQLTRLDRHIERRRSIAQVYYQKLGTIEELKLPFVADWADNAFHLFPIQFVGVLENSRNDFYNELQSNNINCQVHYVPVHRMPLYAGSLGSPTDFPNAETYFSRCLSMPLFPDLSYKEIERITDLLIKQINGKLQDMKVRVPGESEDIEPVENLPVAAEDGSDDQSSASDIDMEDSFEGMSDDEAEDSLFQETFDDEDEDFDQGDEMEDSLTGEDEGLDGEEGEDVAGLDSSGTDTAAQGSPEVAEAPVGSPKEAPVTPESTLDRVEPTEEAQPEPTKTDNKNESFSQKAVEETKANRDAVAGAQKAEEKSEGDSSDDSESAPPAKKSRSAGRLRKVPKKSDEEEGEEAPPPKPKRATRSRTRKAPAKDAEKGSEASESEGKPVAKKTRSTRARKPAKPKESSSGDAAKAEKPSRKSKKEDSSES